MPQAHSRREGISWKIREQVAHGIRRQRGEVCVRREDHRSRVFAPNLPNCCWLDPGSTASLPAQILRKSQFLPFCEGADQPRLIVSDPETDRLHFVIQYYTISRLLQLAEMERLSPRADIQKG